MFRNHYITIAAWIIVYISLWLSRDNLVSSKFSKNNCHTGFVSRIIETMIFPFQWYKNRPTYEYVVGLVLLCCISVVAVIKCFSVFSSIEIFKWYTDDIPARLDQLQKCIDADVNGTVQLTRGKDSLRPLWSWLVANIQLQELTESDLKESLDAVPKWLHEYIVAGKYKLTTESLSIGMDVAIYLGEVFVHEFPQIYWGFFTKPKSRVSVNEPVLLGFENGLDMNPRRIVDTLMWQCANGKSSEGLYEVFEIWSKFVPAQPSKTN